MKLTGFLRFQIVKELMKRGIKQDKIEESIKAVCEAKHIEYTPPKEVKT